MAEGMESDFNLSFLPASHEKVQFADIPTRHLFDPVQELDLVGAFVQSIQYQVHILEPSSNEKKRAS
jgi:hypothetical protein